MNRIWISRNSSIPVREQLSAQILYGILSRRLAPAERLPSVRDLARRLKVHPNTVSAAYRDLGFSLEDLSAAWKKIKRESSQPLPVRPLLVIHPDRNLARILAAEIEEAARGTVAFSGLEDAPPELETFRVLTTTTGASTVANLAPQGHEVIALKSVEELIAGLGRPAAPILIAMVSHSESILKWASLLIPGLQHPSSEVIQRNPEQANWRDGLAACDMIAADIVAARELPDTIRPVVLRLVSEAFLRSLVTPKKA
jgi:hypothetical protein